MICLQCGIDFEAKRDTAKFCSSKCRVTHNRGVTLKDGSVTLSQPTVTDNFHFVSSHKDYDNEKKETISVKTKRTAKYWYDVPLGGEPILLKNWPEKPSYMNCRQYFLWWKNEFKENDGIPEIHNPFPVYDNLRYEKAGEGSRRWGTV